MKVHKKAWNVSVALRSGYLGEVQKYFQYSPAQLAELLTEVARKASYTTRTKAISGSTLVSDAKAGKAPLWLCRAALDLILTQGYMPDSDDEWMSLVSLLILDEEELTHRFYETLPQQISRSAFREWVEIIR